MTGIALCIALSWGVVAGETLSYREAFETSRQSHKPMLVLVGADWCPACQVMKQTTLPRMQRTGQLDQVAFAVVNIDQERKLASKLMRSSLIPQLILFTPTSKGWQRLELQGGQGPESVAALIRKGVRLSVPRPRQDSGAEAEGNTGIADE